GAEDFPKGVFERKTSKIHVDPLVGYAKEVVCKPGGKPESVGNRAERIEFDQTLLRFQHLLAQLCLIGPRRPNRLLNSALSLFVDRTKPVPFLLEFLR